MTRNLRLAGLGIALLLVGSTVAAPRDWAQDATSETGKRKVVSRVEPEYPQVARQMNIAGKVKIEATIAADGRLTSTTVIGGSPFLVNAALEALKKWRFEPASKESTEIFEFEFNRYGEQRALTESR
jgi:TonB family protein